MKTKKEDNNSFEIIELEENKQNEKKKTFKISLIVFFSLMLSFAAIDYFVILSPKKNINNIIETSFNKINNIIVEYTNSNTKTIIESGNLTLNTNIEEYEELNGYNLSYDLEYNKDKSTYLLDMQLNNNIKDIDGKIYYDKDKVYVEFPYLISTMIKFSLEENNIIKIDEEQFKKVFKTKGNDITYILNNIKTIILNNINTNKINKNIKGLDVIIEYNIDNEERIKLLNIITEYLLKDNKTINILKENFNIDENNIVNYQDKLAKKEKEIYIKIYSSYLGNIKKIEFNYDNKNTILSINDEITTIKYNIDYNKSNINTTLSIESYQNGFSIDGNVKFNMLNDKYADISLSNISSINEETKVLDISKARSLKELTETDLNIINKTISSLKGENK